MRLSQDAIFKRLSLEYEVNFLKKIESDFTFERPVFYESGLNLSKVLVVINANDMALVSDRKVPCTDSLLICVGKPEKPILYTENSVIVVGEAAASTGVFNCLQRIYNLFDKWDEALKSICYDGGNFQKIIDCCDPVIFDPISLSDKSFRFVACSTASAERGLTTCDNGMPLEVVNEMISDPAFLSLYKNQRTFTYACSLGVAIIKNLFYRGTYIGRLTVQLADSENMLTYYTFLFDYLAFYIEKMYGRYLSFNQNAIYLSGIRQLLLDSLNKITVTDEQWEKAVKENEWDPGDRLQMIQFRPNPRHDKNMYADYLSAEIEKKWQACVCVDYNNHLLLLVNADKFVTDKGMIFSQALAYFLRDNLLVAGLSRSFNAGKTLYAAFEQTEIALEFGLREKPTLWYFKFNDYILHYILKNCHGTLEKEHIVNEKLLALMKHDAEKNTDYFITLQTYFDCKFNASAASKKLFIQRSTFLYRLERIQELVGIDFDSDDEILHLVISIKIMDKKYCIC